MVGIFEASSWLSVVCARGVGVGLMQVQRLFRGWPRARGSAQQQQSRLSPLLSSTTASAMSSAVAHAHVSSDSASHASRAASPCKDSQLRRRRPRLASSVLLPWLPPLPPLPPSSSHEARRRRSLMASWLCGGHGASTSNALVVAAAAAPPPPPGLGPVPPDGSAGAAGAGASSPTRGRPGGIAPRRWERLPT